MSLKVSGAWSKVSWFPGHMYRGMRLIRERIPDIDIFIEVRDARVPISSFNKEIDNIIKEHRKEKIVLFNKFDLCNKQQTTRVIQEVRSLGNIAIPVSSITRGYDFSSILKSTRIVKTEKYKSTGIWLMIGGMPNVGKSNIINSLRVMSKSFKNNQITVTTSKPCQTTYVSGFKICDEPLTFLVDSPGITLPSINSKEMGMNLGLVGSIKTSIIGKRELVNYMFVVIGESGHENIFRRYSLHARVKTSSDLIDRVVENFKCQTEEIALEKLLGDFRLGLFGHYTLDEVHRKVEEH